MAKKPDIMFSIGENDVDDENQSAGSSSPSGSSSVSDSIPIPSKAERVTFSVDIGSPERNTIQQTIAASAAELSMSPRTFLR